MAEQTPSPSEEASVTDTQRRPAIVQFLKIRDPGRPTTLLWEDPGPTCAGFVVFATQNPFPPQMTGPLFEGKLRSFIDEERLEADRRELRLARPEKFYAVLWFDEDDNWSEVKGLREPAEAASGDQNIDLKAFAATQVRTYLRAKYEPALVEFRDNRVELWIRDIEPNKAALARMAAGEVPPDVILPVRGDGFVDTQTEQEWKKFYVALVVGKDGRRRPLDLRIGGYQRLDEPQFLDGDGRKRYEDIVQLVRNQIEVDVQRKSMTIAEMKTIFERADALAPFHPAIAKLKQVARERFGQNF
jgi:hypothetical protein